MAAESDPLVTRRCREKDSNPRSPVGARRDSRQGSVRCPRVSRRALSLRGFGPVRRGAAAVPSRHSSRPRPVRRSLGNACGVEATAVVGA